MNHVEVNSMFGARVSPQSPILLIIKALTLEKPARDGTRALEPRTGI